VPVGILHLEDRLERLNTGVGEQDVDAAEVLLDPRRSVLQRAEIPLVQPEGYPTASERLDLCSRARKISFGRRRIIQRRADFRSDVDAGNIRPGGSQRGRGSAADAACRAGHHSDLSRKIEGPSSIGHQTPPIGQAPWLNLMGSGWFRTFWTSSDGRTSTARQGPSCGTVLK
jgi:hypothetical protein